MDYHDAKKRLEAALALFAGSTTSAQKISSIRELVRGVHAGIDERLRVCDEAFSHIDKIASGDLVELSAEQLPENTEEEKRRKRALLFFIKSWKELQSEVARVQAELNAQGSGAESALQKKSFWKKIFGGAKGPFALITVAAVGAAVALQATSVHMTIKNNGCGTMIPGSLPIPLPGFSLPKEPIENGGSAVATLPAITVSIDGTTPGVITFGALKLNLSFEIPSNVREVTLDGVSLLKKNTQVKLGERKEHEILFTCK